MKINEEKKKKIVCQIEQLSYAHKAQANQELKIQLNVPKNNIQIAYRKNTTGFSHNPMKMLALSAQRSYMMANNKH